MKPFNPHIGFSEISAMLMKVEILIPSHQLEPIDKMTVTLKDFYADWCGPCKTQDPILEELEDDWEENVTFEKIDVDENQDVANEYQVRSIPTIVIENDAGVVKRFVGVTQRDDLEAALQEAGA